MAGIDSGGNKNFNFIIMKTNSGLILGMMFATAAVAQTNLNTAVPVQPAPVASMPAAVVPAEPVQKVAPVKHRKAAAPKKAPLNEPTVALLPGTAEVASPNLNVRGQAGLKGEVVARLKQGASVTVLSQITLDRHASGEPAQWARIALPASTPVWVHSTFIDPASKTVVPKKLNLRAGPGENFSVLGVLERGAAVQEITSKKGWTQIQPPASACAFVAAMYLKQESSGAMATNVASSTETAPVPAPVLTPVVEAAPIVTEPAPPVPAATPEPAVPALVETNLAVVDTNPPPPRIVSHEGVVRSVTSIIAPTAYVLCDAVTGREINYLYTTSPNLDISRYSGMHIVVTGEEGLAERWKETPVLTIQRIEVLNNDNSSTTSKRLDYRIPRQIH